MPDFTHLSRNLGLSICAGALVLVVMQRSEIPSPSYIYAYLYDLRPEFTDFPGNFFEVAHTLRLPRPKVSVKERTDAIYTELGAKSDIELRAISVAQRPCASGLIECRGLSEGFITRSALAEVAQRAKNKELQLRERDQKMAEASTQAAIDSAAAAARSARAAELNANASNRSSWITGLGSAFAGGMFVLAGLTYRDGRRRDQQTNANNPTTPTTTNNHTTTVTGGTNPTP
jgi:hypothetical protein